MIVLDGQVAVHRVVALEVLVVAESNGIPTDVSLHLVLQLVMRLIIQIKHVHVPGGNGLVNLHHCVVGVGGLTLIDDSLSLLDASLRPVLELVLEPGLRLLLSSELLLLGLLHILLKGLIIHHIQNLVDIRLVSVRCIFRLISDFSSGCSFITLFAAL